MNFYSFKAILWVAVLAGISSASFALPFDMPLGVKLEHSLKSNAAVHQLVLSAPKRINNALSIENERLINGSKTTYLFRISEPASSKAVFDNLLAQAKEQGSVEFVCLERACDSSNYWANSILEERMLYGRDNDQYYFVSKRIVNGMPHWQVVYAVMNGRKRHYVYVAVIEEEVDAFVWENGVSVDSPKLSSQHESYIQSYLAQHPGHQLWIAASLSSKAGASFESLKQQTDQDVIGFKQQIIKQNKLPEQQVKIYSSGPFTSNGHDESTETQYRLFLLAP